MPQTVQDLCLSDWKVGYTVDVTFLLQGQIGGGGVLKEP